MVAGPDISILLVYHPLKYTRVWHPIGTGRSNEKRMSELKDIIRHKLKALGVWVFFFAPRSIVVWFLFWFQKIPFWRQSMPPHFETQCCDEMILEGKPSWCFQIQNITKIYKFQGPLCVVVLRLGIYVSCTLNISYHTTPRFCEGRRVAYFEREKVGDKRKNSFFQTPRCHNLWCGMIWGNNGCESMVGDFAVQYDWTLF